MLAVAAGVLIYRSERSARSPDLPAPEGVSAIIGEDVSKRQPIPLAASPAVVKSREVVSQKTVTESAPDLEEIRREVSADPHTLPHSLLSFSLSLGDRMKEARHSPETAKKFFAELSECVNSQKLSGTRTLQAICLSNARRLTESVPELQVSFKRLEESAPSEIQKLSR